MPATTMANSAASFFINAPRGGVLVECIRRGGFRADLDVPPPGSDCIRAGDAYTLDRDSSETDAFGY
jgi:hypothetical protein